MADVTKLAALLEAYGVGVRAGVITPCLEDEAEFRLRMGLPPPSPSVVAYWKTTDGVRKPITLNYEGKAAPAPATPPSDRDAAGDEEDDDEV